MRLCFSVFVAGLASVGCVTAVEGARDGARPLAYFKQQVQQALDRAQKVMAKGVKPQDYYAHIMKKAKTRAVYTK